jgi:hypothetical protein
VLAFVRNLGTPLFTPHSPHPTLWTHPPLVDTKISE